MNLHDALAHHQAGRLAEAEAIYREVLAAQPTNADALHLLGVVAAATGRLDEALEPIRRAIALRPAQGLYHSNLGVTLRRLGRLDEAVASLSLAAMLDPSLADAHLNLGEVLLDLARFDEAIACSRRALALQPNLAEAWNNIAVALAHQQRFDEALDFHRRAVALDANCAQAWNNLGNSLFELGRWDEAIAHYRRVLELAPDFAAARSNLALACAALGRTDEALALYRESLATQPGVAGTHWNFALLLLQLGHYEEGWREYEWRWHTALFGGLRESFPGPQWDGAPVPGRTLAICTEQGLGDTLHFMRYVPLVRERSQAARVVVDCPPELARLLAQSGDWNAEIATRPNLPACDLHVPLLSLPLALKMFEPMTMTAPYLRAGDTLRAQWRERLRPGFRVGLAWAGSSIHAENRWRSIPFARLRPLLGAQDASFYSLQIEPRAPADLALIDLTASITDFADTAALVAELDLVITADTAVAHLAGAMGRPVWVMLPFFADWRWGFSGERTPWYPTMRLFRQRTAWDWDEVIARVAAELGTLTR